MATRKARKAKLYVDPETGLVYADIALFREFKRNIAGPAGIRYRPGAEGDPVPLVFDDDGPPDPPPPNA